MTHPHAHHPTLPPHVLTTPCLPTSPSPFTLAPTSSLHHPDPTHTTTTKQTGETHYIVITIKKSTLLKFGVLKEDKPSSDLLTKANLDEGCLKTLSRQVSKASSTSPSTHHHSASPPLTTAQALHPHHPTH